jgi:hypothetical protein
LRKPQNTVILEFLAQLGAPRDFRQYVCNVKRRPAWLQQTAQRQAQGSSRHRAGWEP